MRDLNYLIKHSIAYFILTFSVILIYVLSISSFNYIFRPYPHFQTSLSTISAALVVALFFQTFRKKLKDYIEQTLFFQEYQSQRALKDASKVMTSLTDLDPLLKLICRIVTRRLKLKGACAFVYQEKESGFNLHACEGYRENELPALFAPDSALIKQLKETEKIVETSRLQKNQKELKTLLTKLRLRLILPAFCRGRLIAFLGLSEKKSRRDFSSDELKLLSALTLQGAIAIDNAILYNSLLNRAEQIKTLFMASKKITLQLELSEKLRELGQAILDSIPQIKGCTIQLHGETKLSLGNLESLDLIPVELTAGDKTIGCLIVYTEDKSLLAARDLDLILIFAGQTAAAIKLTELYQDLKEAQNKLIQSERLATVGKMTALVAQELKNPLTKMQTLAEEIHGKIEDAKFREEFNQLVSAEIDKLDKVVNEVLTYARNKDAVPDFFKSAL